MRPIVSSLVFTSLWLLIKGDYKAIIYKIIMLQKQFPHWHISENVKLDSSASFQFLGSVIRDKENEFTKDLLLLSQQPQFILRDFETVIEKIRSYVAEVSLIHLVKGHKTWRMSVT